MSSEVVKAARNSGARVVAAWCAERNNSKHVAALIAVDEGYWLSCQHFDQERGRYVECSASPHSSQN
jgi:hypothetical protein